MGSQVLYRKWRPQTLAEVVGQELVTKTLLNALAADRIAHAYLFCGPRGTGKTSTGRILAKAINCLSGGKGEPCNICSVCQLMNEGRALDLVEIDGASNRGIDEIRDLRERVRYAPSVLRKKVYIIDEVHMLTEPAFNALLKTLEEPPPHVVFILATTEVHKIPLTIISRCQRFDFRRISQQSIITKLQAICNHEAIEIHEKALSLVAKSSTGSLRDAENILEQLFLHRGARIGFNEAREELGFGEDEQIEELAKCILGGDIANSVAIIHKMAVDGIDIRRLNHNLVEFLRNMLLIKTGVDMSGEMPPEMIAEVKKYVSKRSIEELSTAIKLFAQIDFRGDMQYILPLELAIVDYFTYAKEEHGRLSKKVGAKQSSGEEIDKSKSTLSEKRTEESDGEKERLLDIPRYYGEKEQAVEPATAGLSNIASVANNIPPPPHNIDQIRNYWPDFIKACRGMGSTGNLDALLRSSCEVTGVEGDVITLDFRHEWHKNKIEDPKYRHQVEVKLQEVFGVPYRINCTISGKIKESQSAKQRNPVIEAALKMGARIIEEEKVYDE